MDEKVEKKVSGETPKLADFETAINSTGYGLFNYLLLLLAIPSCLATVYETSTMSYILPSAECDLKLTMLDKGVLNAITYAGMMTSAIFWGYMADTLGRKKLLVYGYLLDGICVVLCAFSQNLYTLMIFKYLGGFLICGPFAVLMSFVTEFHGVKHRGRVMMFIGSFFSIATVSLPAISYGILPRNWELIIIDDVVVLHSWHVFLCVCAMPSLISGILVIFFPESPKFLMSRGKNDEAMKVFKMIFAVNTGKPKDEYPIKSLVNEIPEDKSPTPECNGIHGKECAPSGKGHQSAMDSLRHGLLQLKPMFLKPYLGHSLHVYTIQFSILLGLNTLRLWLPQLFTMIASFEEKQIRDSTSEPSNLCVIISYGLNKTQVNTGSNSSDSCVVDIPDQMYFNTMIVGMTSLLGYFVAGSLINALGNKRILVIVLLISGICGIVMFWSTTSVITLILSSVFVSVGSIGSTALIGVIVNLFPTSLRTMTVSLAMMFGRSGALLGNIMFPLLMSLGCFPPFLMVSIVMIIGSFLCCFLPVTHKSALQ